MEYFQGWMSKAIETTGHKQAAWRSDPAQSGPGGAIGDIGTHAFHLLEYISGLQVTGINATLRSVVEGRRLDDDCNAFVRLSNGAAGTLACSQVAAGELNEMRMRIYGEIGSIDWRQQDPNRLIVKWLDGPEEIHHAAAPLSGRRMRLPSAAFRPDIRKVISRLSRCSIASLPMRWSRGRRGTRTRCRPHCRALSPASAA